MKFNVLCCLAIGILTLSCMVSGISEYKSIVFTGPADPGYVEFHMLANPSQDNTIYVMNDLQTDGNWSKITLPADGVGSDLWQAGNYTAYVNGGNGNQRETQHFKIGGWDTTRVVFIGSAISEPMWNPQLCTRPIAAFDSSIPLIPAGSSVQFIDTSSNNPTRWEWSFTYSDNSISHIDSTLKDPVWTFNTPGVVSVRLTVINDCGYSEVTKTQYINVYGV